MDRVFASRVMTSAVTATPAMASEYGRQAWNEGGIEVRGIERRWGYCAGSATVILAGLYIVFMPVSARTPPAQQEKPPVTIAGSFDQVRVLPPGGPAPRTADGHPDLTGRWYPNQAGRMLQFAYSIDPLAMKQFDPSKTPELAPSFRPGLDDTYTRPVPYGECDQAGTPSATLEQIIQHAPMELIQTQGRLAILHEYPLNVRMIYMNGRVHPKNPDPTFNGDSTARWEGDTLVVDVIAIDERLRIISGVGGGGGNGSGAGWFPSSQQHVIERFSRPSKNYLIYQVTIEDPVVLAKPWTSAPRRWTLAAPDDEWGEVFCTLNEEPAVWKNMMELEAQSKGK
jgi:hypothetical protein